MNIHEYQAKEVLKKYGIKMPKGKIAYTPSEAVEVAKEVSPRGPWVIKSQIHSGARRRGYFLEKKAGNEGGIRIVNNKKALFKETMAMLNSTLVTIQTGHKGKLVNKVYIEEFTEVERIFYSGMVIDRMKPAITMIFSFVSDEDIISVAIADPKKVLKFGLDLDNMVSYEQVKKVQDFLNLPEKNFDELSTFINGLHRAFVEKDATMIEINPVGLTKDGKLIALDAKMNLDNSALYRHPDITNFIDESEYSERRLRAIKSGFSYDEFEGNVGLIVNGEGVSLALMDLIRKQDFNVACSLNVKGGVDKDKIAAGIRIIMTNPKVEGILIYILGGFLRCNLIAEGIIAVASEVGLNVPLVVRFEGVNKGYAQDVLAKSDLPITIASDMEESVDSLLSLMREDD